MISGRTIYNKRLRCEDPHKLDADGIQNRFMACVSSFHMACVSPFHIIFKEKTGIIDQKKEKTSRGR